MRYKITSAGPVPNGDRPLAAYATVSPQAKTSPAGPDFPLTCSGAMNPGDPMLIPVRVTDVASSVCAMPKSITFGPSAVSSTLPGLRSRCTTPAAWMAASASASPAARLASIPGPNGPSCAAHSASVGPAAYSVTR